VLAATKVEDLDEMLQFLHLLLMQERVIVIQTTRELELTEAVAQLQEPVEEDHQYFKNLLKI
jgi:hypothetical protein